MVWMKWFHGRGVGEGPAMVWRAHASRVLAAVKETTKLAEVLAIGVSPTQPLRQCLTLAQGNPLSPTGLNWDIVVSYGTKWLSGIKSRDLSVGGFSRDWEYGFHAVP